MKEKKRLVKSEYTLKEKHRHVFMKFKIITLPFPLYEIRSAGMREVAIVISHDVKPT